MCLEKISVRKVATEDIVVYKRLAPIINRGNICSAELDGKFFKGVINNHECEGKIKHEGTTNFFCTNNPNLNGLECKDRLGFKNSWVYDGDVSEIEVEGSSLIFVEGYHTPYQHMEVKIGETYTSHLIAEFDEVNIGLHSFADLDGAKYDGRGVIAECIIPKGAEYYEGMFQDRISLASDKLTYVKVVA